MHLYAHCDRLWLGGFTNGKSDPSLIIGMSNTTLYVKRADTNVCGYFILSIIDNAIVKQNINQKIVS